MSIELASNAIRTHFAANVSVFLSITVAYDNVLFTPEPDVEHLTFSIRPAASLQVEAGNTRRFRNPGIMAIGVFTTLDQGERRAWRIVDQIVKVFRGVTLAGGITFRAPHVTVLGRGEAKWQVSVACPFYYDDLVRILAVPTAGGPTSLPAGYLPAGYLPLGYLP